MNTDQLSNCSDDLVLLFAFLTSGCLKYLSTAVEVVCYDTRNSFCKEVV